MIRAILWILIALSMAWMVWRRLQKGSGVAAIGLIFGILAAAYLGLACLLFVFQPRLVYMPMRKIDQTPALYKLPFEEVRIATDDGQTLAGWYLPAEAGRLTVLFCHGNAGNISHRLDTLAVFHEKGLNCLIFDYRGYGQSSGRPTETGTIRDALAAHRWLIREKQTQPGQIILFGRSLGGAVAAQAAVQLNGTPPAGLVLESTFTSVPDLGAHLYPWLPVRWFARFSYNTQAALENVTCPVAVIHSPDDEMIPFAMGRALYEAAAEPKFFAELKGTHNEGFIDNLTLYETIWSDILTFLNETPSNRGLPRQD